MTFEGLRLGLTMRIEKAAGYDELRDCIAADWHGFLREALPGATWIPIPNVGTDTPRYLETTAINALVLTGGNDIGEHSLKDDTDMTALDHALARGWPIFGVCRGMQVLQTYFGGELARVSAERHVAAQHRISVLEPAAAFGLSACVSVNSFHGTGILQTKLADRLQSLAICDDGTVEAAGIRGHAGVAVMWHPERNHPAAEADVAIVRKLFRDGKRSA